MPASYDRIGVNYADRRRPDTRIADMIDRALGDARTVVNVGAGTGSYEPSNRAVTAVEPSSKMIRQRKPSAAPVVQASAEDLPFEDDAFDAAMAVLTIHHWTDKAQGCAEMSRIARKRIVLLTFDPDRRDAWLLDYFPEFADQDDQRFPKMEDYSRWLGNVTVENVPIYHDCTDGFLYAYWRRPRAYLDPTVRSAMSSFWALDDPASGLARLEKDLESGAWEDRYGDYLEREFCDLGYRLITAEIA